jgi:hypothetical protein
MQMDRRNILFPEKKFLFPDGKNNFAKMERSVHLNNSSTDNHMVFIVIGGKTEKRARKRITIRELPTAYGPVGMTTDRNNWNNG